MKKSPAEKFEAPLSDVAKQQLEYQIMLEKIIYQTKEELYCKGRYKSFFEHYNEETIHCFIEEYAMRKAIYLLDGEQLLKKEDARLLYFRNLTENFIWEIQQKKLFDLQCLWRAEKIKIDQVDVTKDFSYLESTIKSNLIVGSITRDELQIYIDYVLSEDYADSEHGLQWQDYESITTGNHSDLISVPAWYNYYDKVTRIGTLLNLPDIKGEKENFYVDLLKKNSTHHSTRIEQENKNCNGEKPALKFNYKTLEFFVTTFEDKSLIKYFTAAEKNHPELNNNFELDAALTLLGYSDEKISIQANTNWKDAVIEAAHYFKTKKIAETLLQVFDEYNLRIKAGIPFYNETDLLRQQLVYRAVNLYKKRILQARKLNGEPADFSF